ncbi:MAG: UvrD-helicase domain-containing protein [Myxococcota bacterium]|nr:UvrD-helicase domain-containing protein [Myxococcota bacterium]
MTRAPEPLPDAEARRRIREELEETFFVEAAAGTGKTRALVERIVALLRAGVATLDSIVSVTFTEKAAGEMKLRLRAEIERARRAADTSAPERRNLDRALEQLELAKIGTIHAFCGDLLHERPVEAGVDPLFQVAPEEESERLLERAFESWFQRALADPPEGVRRMLRRRPRGRDAPGPREQLRGAVLRLVEHRDFPARWRREPFARDGEIDAILEELAAVGGLAARAARPDDWLAKGIAAIDRFGQELRLRESVRPRDHDGLESELRELVSGRNRFWNWKGRQGEFAPGLPRDDVLARRDALKARIDRFVEACDADLAALLQAELAPVVESYQALCARAGVLDFLDLLVRARDLLRDSTEVRAEQQRRFSHFFVDEFQDTDPLQAEILLLIAADDPAENDWRRVRPRPGKLFVVGDPKQSIYRFRRADVAIYEEVKRQLASRGAQVLHLSTSFRAVPAIQSLVNASFAPWMQGSESGSQAEYVPLERARASHREQPSLVALPVPRPYGDYGRIVKWRIDESLPDAVGAFVDWLVTESGWTVEEEGRRVPVRARHVCLLFRRFRSWQTDVTRPYVRALEARRVAHVLVGGRSFHEREEVLALRNALCALEWPDDELHVYATLRGPLFALGDDALLAFRHAVGRLHPLRRIDEASLAALEPGVRAVAEAVGLLARLHQRRNHRPIAETLGRLLEAVRAHAGIAIWPTGEQALANCLRVVDLARRFERGGAPSFRSFVERLLADAESGEAQDAPVVEEGTEGVRIMTVHKAKGLEFPVVILADPTANLVGRNPSRHVDPERRLWAETLCGCVPHELRDAADAELERDRDEAVRLAYVAATRARDLLVVPVVGDEASRGAAPEGWFDVLHPAVFPMREKRRRPHRAPGCPTFGDDSVFERPSSCEVPPAASVRPGLHDPEAGRHRVVWWDPAALELDRQEEVGLRQQRILEADESGGAEAGASEHARWQEARAGAHASGELPTLSVLPVTAAAGADAGEGPAAGAEAGEGDAAVEVAEVPGDRAARPAGARFGTLVHAVLAAVDLDADAAAVSATARAQGRLLGAPQSDVVAAAEAVSAALAHPLLRRAASAPAVRRETPVLLRRDDGSLVEGVVDLAFREDEGDTPTWTVVDFKTDRDPTPHLPDYRAQVRLYAQAITQATTHPTTPTLLLV